MIRDLMILTAICALVALAAWQALGVLTMNIGDRPRMCDGLTVHDCFAAVQREKNALIKWSE